MSKFPGERVLQSPPPHGNRKYPWERWSDGKWREVDPSVYGVSPEALKSVVVNWADRRDLKTETRLLDNGRLAFVIHKAEAAE